MAAAPGFLSWLAGWHVSGLCWVLCVELGYPSIGLIGLPVPPQILGPSVLAGVGLMVLLIPLNGAVAMKMHAYQVGAVGDPHIGPGAPLFTSWSLRMGAHKPPAQTLAPSACPIDQGQGTLPKSGVQQC